MPEVALQIIKWLVPWLANLVRDKTQLDPAIDLVENVVMEMLRDAETKGVGQLSVAFRAPYEARMAVILHQAGMLETV